MSSILKATMILPNYMHYSQHGIYYMYRKVPGQGQKRNAGLTYPILAAISFKIVSLGMYTVIP
jgi:hypothetical protein